MRAAGGVSMISYDEDSHSPRHTSHGHRRDCQIPLAHAVDELGTDDTRSMLLPHRHSCTGRAGHSIKNINSVRIHSKVHFWVLLFSPRPLCSQDESLWSHTGSPNLVQLHKDIARLGGVLWVPDRVMKLDVQLSRVV